MSARKATMRHAERRRGMPALRSAQYVSAIPPAPAAEKMRVAASPAIVIWYDALTSSRR
jgi:hypothetical protein